jgi:hypothetical protein
VAYANYPRYWPAIQRMIWGDQLETISDQTFRDDRIVLDGHEYTNCTFYNVTFEYDGGPYKFTHNKVYGALFETKNSDMEKAFRFAGAIGLLKIPMLDKKTQKQIEPGAKWNP